MRELPVLLLSVLLLVPACSSGGRTNTIPETPPYRSPLERLVTQPENVHVPPPKRGTGGEFTAEQRRFMRDAFRTFMRETSAAIEFERDPAHVAPPDAPRWPDLRREWVGMGEDAVHTLVENLLVYLLAAQNAARPEEAGRAQAELVDLGPPAFPYLLGALSLETFEDRTGERQRVDEMTRRTAAETLSLMGEPVIEPLLARLPTFPEPSRRVVAVELANLVDPRVTRALVGLLDDPSNLVAADAAWALRVHPGADVSRALVRVYCDRKRDVLVRTKAGEALLDRRDPAVLPDLVKLLEEGLATDDLGLIRSTGAILRATTRERIGNDPAAWRAYLERGDGAGR